VEHEQRASLILALFLATIAVTTIGGLVWLGAATHQLPSQQLERTLTCND